MKIELWYYGPGRTSWLFVAGRMIDIGRVSFGDALRERDRLWRMLKKQEQSLSRSLLLELSQSDSLRGVTNSGSRVSSGRAERQASARPAGQPGAARGLL